MQTGDKIFLLFHGKFRAAAPVWIYAESLLFCGSEEHSVDVCKKLLAAGELAYPVGAVDVFLFAAAVVKRSHAAVSGFCHHINSVLFRVGIIPGGESLFLSTFILSYLTIFVNIFVECCRNWVKKSPMFVTFAEYRGGGSITSRCGGGSDKVSSMYLTPITKVSITSRWGGSSDCKPTSPHGYAANRDLNFWKTFIMLHFYHSYKYSLAHLYRNVNRFPAKKAAWLSPPPALNGRSVIGIGIDDRNSDTGGSADNGSKYASTHEYHLLNVESEKNHQKMSQRSGESSRRGSGFMILLMVSPPFI